MADHAQRIWCELGELGHRVVTLCGGGGGERRGWGEWEWMRFEWVVCEWDSSFNKDNVKLQSGKV